MGIVSFTVLLGGIILLLFPILRNERMNLRALRWSDVLSAVAGVIVVLFFLVLVYWGFIPPYF
jgi:hypothetical protein